MTAVVAATMVAFLMERLMRSFDLLAQSSKGFEFLSQLMLDLTPHYLGLVLPAAFFIGLFVAVNRLNQGSEVDAILASGISIGRLATPFVGLGLALMVFSLALYGFVQPYSRYAYHAVLHAAENAGWNGEVRPMALVAPSPRLAFTADDVDVGGRELRGVFIRSVAADGSESVFTAARAVLERDPDGRMATLHLTDGRQLLTPAGRSPVLITFKLFTLRLPLAPTEKLMRQRGGGEVSELTLVELFREATGAARPLLSRQTLLAEFYSRLARALSLPLMPLLALPFGLSARRSGSSPAMAVGGVFVFGFLASLVFGQGLASTGSIPAALAVGGPSGLFAAGCITTFLLSRARPGENPVNWITERAADLFLAVSRGAAPRAGSRPHEEERDRKSADPAGSPRQA